MKGTVGEPCPSCGKLVEAPPLCYGAEPPWRLLGIPENEVDKRVDLTADQCVVDAKQFFMRGHIELTILGQSSTFAWSVWCSLSEKSFTHACERWLNPERVNDPPYFGWLMTALPCYPDTVHLKTTVQPREVGVIPNVILEPSGHPLSIEQRNGITLARVSQFAHEILHAESNAG